MHPILFRLGPITLYSYGLMLAVGFMSALWVATTLAKRSGLDPRRIQTVAFTAILAGIVGARAAYVLLNWSQYRQTPFEIFRLDHGGLVFYGGLAAGLLAGVWTIRRYGFPLLKTVDLFIPPLALGQAIGRIGCFLNGCCYGKPTSFPWGATFPNEGIPRHPTQLYESGALFLIFLILLRVSRRRPRPGMVLLAYGFLYGSWRFAIEFFRGDNPIFAWGLTVFQWVSLPLAIGCGLILLQRRFYASHGSR